METKRKLNPFNLLSDKLQRIIKKRFKNPTLIQELTIPKILEGKNVLAIAPTGVGKTEAALLGIFDMWLREKPKPISILYITPLKSLNRDLLDRIIWWGNELGMEVTVRHGDTSPYQRRLQVEFPNDLMISTLETLQPILIGKKLRELLKNVKWVVIDECLPYDTEIMLSDGSSKKIGEIVENNLKKGEYNGNPKNRIYVKTLDEKTGKIKTSKVSKVHKIPLYKDMIYVRTKYYNLDLSMTSDHPVLVIKNKKPEWVKAKDLRINDKILVFNRSCNFVEKEQNKKQIDTKSLILDKETFYLISRYLLAKKFARNNKIKLIDKVKKLKREGYTDFEIMKKLGFSKQYKYIWTLRHKIKGERLLGFPRFKKWKKLILGDCLIDEIAVVKVTNENTKDFVYDLTVEGTHNFIANNIIVHNCHEMVDSKRGVQLAVGLERLKELCGNFQLIMLSATVGEPEKVAKFFSSNKEVEIVKAVMPKGMDIKVINPKTKPADRSISKKIFCSNETAARLRTIMELIKEHRSVLAFTNTREFAEILASRIKTIDKKFPAGIHHSSLSKSVRIKTEKDFKEEKLKSIISTSSLQLGIDIGSIDLVLQYMSPRQITQAVQRIGRSGHELERISKGIIISTDEDDIFESAVIARKALQGELEPVRFHSNSLDVLAHQIVGLTLEYWKLELGKAYEIIRRANPYSKLSFTEFLEVCKQLEKLGLVFLNSHVKKKRRGFNYYFTNLSTIPDVKQYRIFNTLDNSFVGVLDEEFVALHGEPNTTFIVKGEAWRIIDIDEERIFVEPTEDIEAAVPGWEGELIPVSFEVAQEVGKLRKIIAENLKDKEDVKTKLQRLYPIDDNCARKMVDIIKKQVKYGVVPDDKTILVEDYEDLVILHTCFGSLVNETLGRFMSALLTPSIGSVGLKTDPYRIVFQFQAKNLDLVKEILFKTNPDFLKSYLEMSLSKSNLFEWKFVHVAKRFGAIARDAEYGKVRMKRIIEDYVGSPIYKETLKELETEKLDVEKAVEILKNIQSKKIEVVFKKGLSPLGKIGIKHKFAEVIGPERPEREIFNLFKERLLDTEVRLVCLNCGKWDQIFTVREMPKDVRCKKCEARLLGVVRPKDSQVLKIISKKLRKKPITRYESIRFERVKKTAELYLNYRKNAVIALAGRGVGPVTATRILAKPYKTKDEFLKAILEAERNWIRTRRYWSA